MLRGDPGCTKHLFQDAEHFNVPGLLYSVVEVSSAGCEAAACRAHVADGCLFLEKTVLKARDSGSSQAHQRDSEENPQALVLLSSTGFQDPLATWI